MRLHRLGLIFAVVLGVLPLSVWAKPLVAKSVKVYKGADGIRVTVVRLRAKGAALVQVTGTETDLDGNVYRIEIKAWDNNEDWTTYELPVGRYVLIAKRAGQYELYTPGKSDSVRLTFDENATGEAKAEPIIAGYEAAHPAAAKPSSP